MQIMDVTVGLVGAGSWEVGIDGRRVHIGNPRARITLQPDDVAARSPLAALADAFLPTLPTCSSGLPTGEAGRRAGRPDR